MGGDAALAADLVSRALFTLEMTFHPSFAPASGTCRMRYAVFENRALYLALFRHTHFVAARGARRCECCAKII